MNSIFTYFKQVRSELRHVIWPSRETTIVYTIVVIVVSLFIAAYLGLLDYVFSNILQRVI